MTFYHFLGPSTLNSGVFYAGERSGRSMYLKSSLHSLQLNGEISMWQKEQMSVKYFDCSIFIIQNMKN